MDAFDRLWTALGARGRQPKRGRDGKGRATLRALCPSHPDRRPSLTATRTDAGVLLNCFGGCPLGRVLEALDMTRRDLLHEAPALASPTTRVIVATYSYVGEAGNLVAEKVRYGPVKHFGWRSPDPAQPGAWRTGITGPERPTLYRLDELIDERRVVVVEGEKAVDLLRTLGVPATCGPHGAKTWRAEWTAMLWRGGAREALVIADNDAAGRDHAERVAASVSDFVPRVIDVPVEGCPLTIDAPDDARMVARLVRLDGLAPGEDVADWIAAGHDAVDLLTVATRTPVWSATLDADERLRRKRELNRLRQQRYRDRKRQSPAVPTARPEDAPAHPEVRH